jgi:hypothetical protein
MPDELNQLRTALVVLAVPADQSAGGYTAGHRPAEPPEGAESVRQWFSAKGFAVEPVVGIAFAISGSGRLFDSTFGNTFGNTVGHDSPGATQQLDQSALAGRLDANLLRYVAAVVIGPPPDFGPDNP